MAFQEECAHINRKDHHSSLSSTPHDLCCTEEQQEEKFQQWLMLLFPSVLVEQVPPVTTACLISSCSLKRAFWCPFGTPREQLEQFSSCTTLHPKQHKHWGWWDGSFSSLGHQMQESLLLGLVLLKRIQYLSPQLGNWARAASLPWSILESFPTFLFGSFYQSPAFKAPLHISTLLQCCSRCCLLIFLNKSYQN